MTLLGTFIVLALVWIWKHPGAILRVFILVGFATVAGVVVVRDRRHGLPTPWAKLAVLAGAWELHGVHRRLRNYVRQEDTAAYAHYQATGGARGPSRYVERLPGD